MSNKSNSSKSVSTHSNNKACELAKNFFGFISKNIKIVAGIITFIAVLPTFISFAIDNYNKRDADIYLFSTELFYKIKDISSTEATQLSRELDSILIKLDSKLIESPYYLSWIDTKRKMYNHYLCRLKADATDILNIEYGLKVNRKIETIKDDILRISMNLITISKGNLGSSKFEDLVREDSKNNLIPKECTLN